MARFKVWCPDWCDEPEKTNTEATCPEVAAIYYVERRHADNDYPETTTVYVRDWANEQSTWTVTAQPSIEFSVTEAK